VEPPWAAAQRRTGADGFFGAQRPRGAARKPRRRRARRGKKLAATVSNGVDPPVGLTPTAREKWSRTTVETAALQRIVRSKIGRQGQTRAKAFAVRHRPLPNSAAVKPAVRGPPAPSGTRRFAKKAVAMMSLRLRSAGPNQAPILLPGPMGLLLSGQPSPREKHPLRNEFRVFRFPVSSRCPSESDRPWLGRRASPAWLRSEGKHSRYRASLPRTRCL